MEVRGNELGMVKGGEICLGRVGMYAYMASLH